MNEKVTEKVKLNIVLVGDLNTGKTGLVRAWENPNFFDGNKEYNSTISTDFFSKSYVLNNVRYQCDLWDTCGGSSNPIITSKKPIDAFIVTFDLNNPTSLGYAKEKIKLLEEQYQNVPIFLTGTKSDLVGVNGTENIKNQIDKFNQNKYNYLETSAKKNTNIEQRFKSICQLKQDRNRELKKQQQMKHALRLPDEQNKQQNLLLKPNQPRSRGKRFAIGLGVSLFVIAGLFALVTAAYLFLPAVAGTFMLGLGLAIAKTFSITALTTVLTTASAQVIAVTLGAIVAAGVAGLAMLANLINGVRHIYGSVVDSTRNERDFIMERDYSVHEERYTNKSTKKLIKSLDIVACNTSENQPPHQKKSCWKGWWETKKSTPNITTTNKETSTSEAFKQVSTRI